jgi:hypothetical protein
MTREPETIGANDQADIRPWYREPWPWVAIAIPAVSILMGLITLYLAISNPDYLVVEEDQYRQIKSEMRAQAAPEGSPARPEIPHGQDDGAD